jgi:leucyl aminopeptidase
VAQQSPRGPKSPAKAVSGKGFCRPLRLGNDHGCAAVDPAASVARRKIAFSGARRGPTMKVTFTGLAAPRGGALVVLAGEGLALARSAQALDGELNGLITRAAEAAAFKGGRGTFLDLIAPPGLAVDRVVVAGFGDPAKLDEAAQVRLGGALAGRLGSLGVARVAVRVDPIEKAAGNVADLAARLALGLGLRTYRFDKYRTKPPRDGRKPDLTRVAIQTAAPRPARAAHAALAPLVEGVHLARDLVNEPANVLFPAEFAKRLKPLEKLGIKLTILGEKELEKLGMGALLAVGMASRRESQVAVMQWQGGGKEAPVAFVGKGVTFDTGGISLKPAANMGDMKGDMAGAACVAGLMHTLASRKARINAVGLVGLVENMPDGRAQRPGDVVRSFSGRTIEVLNTDAEGRLVLADVLAYAIDRFKPRAVIDLATLTGAIVVALGKHAAGLFSNDDALADRLFAAGEATGEKVWRMPMGEDYDKAIDSKVADMKNIGGRDAGAVTAAQFLARFVGDTAWAHLDIAGTALDSPKDDLSQGWTSGFGVRLLNRLVADAYEK